MKESAASQSKRDPALDAAKGLLILTVVFAHCFTEGALHDFIFSFHMPAFFMIAGITASLSRDADRPLGQTLWRLIRSLAIPYLFFELLGVLQELIRNGFSQSWKGFLFNSLTLRCNNIVDWFLGTLLLAKLLSLLLRLPLRRLLKRKAAQISYLALSLGAMGFALLLTRTEPFVFTVVRRVLVAHGFLAIGLVLEPSLRKSCLPGGFVALAGAFGLSLLNTGFADINELHFGNPGIFLAAALLGSWGAIQMGKLLPREPLLWLGKNSLIIMGTHIPILLLARYAFGTTAPGVWQRVGDFALILLLELPTVLFINRFLPFLAGKRYPRRKSDIHSTS